MPFLLQKFTQHDFSDYFSLVSNLDVMQMITERAIPLPEAQSDYAKILENNKIDDHFGHFKIINPENHQFIGLAKLEIQEKIDETTEIGYILLPTYWGQGIASHITQQLLEIAKNQESLQTVFAIIDPSNLASKKILMKHAFKSKEFKDFDGLPGEILELNLR